jgi:hypothetical protein
MKFKKKNSLRHKFQTELDKLKIRDRIHAQPDYDSQDSGVAGAVTAPSPQQQKWLFNWHM